MPPGCHTWSICYLLPTQTHFAAKGFAERLRFKPYVIFILLWATLVYAPFAHLAWGGGLFAKWGVMDFAGGTVVHITSGWGALGTILVLGKRHQEEGEEEKPHNVPFILLGTAILWFGWFGFNGGSALMAGPVAAVAYLNSQLSAASALWSWLLIDWLYKGKPSLVGACVGAVAGLVGITPCAGYVQPWSALVIGVIVTIVCQVTCEVRRLFLAKWLDDALDVWGTHGVGGLVGAILVGVLSDPSDCAPGADSGLKAPAWCVSQLRVPLLGSGAQAGRCRLHLLRLQRGRDVPHPQSAGLLHGAEAQAPCRQGQHR